MYTPRERTISEYAAELITDSGRVPIDVINQAHAIARRMRIPFGRTLVMAGYLGEGDLTSLLQAAVLLKQHKLTKRQAAPILRKALNECFSFNDLLAQESKPASKLAKLLIAAKVITPEQVAELTARAERNSLTLGRILVFEEVLTVRQLSETLYALALIRDNIIAEDVAVTALRSACAWGSTFKDALAHLSITISPEKPRLGELLTGADILCEFDLLTSVEIGIEMEVPLAEVLLERELCSPVLLKAALRLQQMVASKRFNCTQAQELLRQAHVHCVPIEVVLCELSDLKRNIVEFLKHSRTVTEGDLLKAVEACPIHMDDLAQALIASGSLKIMHLKAAVHCLDLIQNDKISMTQSIFLFQHCVRSDISVAEALATQHWNEQRDPGATKDHGTSVRENAVGAA